MTRRLLAALSILAVAVVVSARADSVKVDNARIKTTGTSSGELQPDRMAAEQALLKQEFLEFKQSLLRLAQNFELSSKPELKDKAAILREAIKLSGEKGVDAKFNTLIEKLRSPKIMKDFDLITEADQLNKELHRDLQQLIRILMSDNRSELLKAERLRTEKLLEQLKDIIRKQERLRAQTEGNRRDTKDIAKGQKDVSDETKRLIGEGKDDKGKEAKPGEAKSHGKDTAKEGAEGRGEGKKDTPENKADGKPSEGKDGDGKPNDGKQGEPKDGKGNDSKEGKPGEAKDAKGGEGKEGQSKEGKPGDGKPGEGKDKKGDGKEGKPGAGKDSQGKEGKPSDGKGGDGKEGQPKDGKGGDSKEGKPGEGKEGKGGEGKEGAGKDGKGMGNESKPGTGKEGGKAGMGKDGKPGDGKGQPNKEAKPNAGKPGAGKEAGKPGDGKPGAGKEGKPGDGKPGAGKEGKPGDPKAGKPGQGGESKGKGDGKGEAKGEAKGGKPGMGGEGKPSEGKPGGGEGKPGGQGKPGQGGQPPPGGQQPPPQNQEQAQVRKQIQEGNKSQDEAKDELDKDNRDKASGKQDDAIKKLEEARKKLEELLKQIREEEIERLLAALQARCEDMLKMQVQVYDGTVDVFNRAKSTDGKLTREQAQRSVEMSGTENEIVKMANVAIGLIEAEGSAIAFAEVFKQVRDDMIKVANRLKTSDVALITQNIERDIIESLKEMIDALKKEQKKNQEKKKSPPSKPKESGPQKPPEQDLIDLIAELKMIRSMQVRVNKRTEDYHKYYPGVEQVPDISAIKDKTERDQIDMVQQELKNLTERQDSIKRITRDIATGKNKTRD